MARKSRNQRRVDPPRETVVEIRARPEPQRTPRSTFGVARALDEAGRALGPLLYRKGDKPKRAEPARDISPPLRPLAEKPALKSRPVEARPLTMDRREMETCKSRPDARQSRGGDGGARPFVPWCGRKS